MRGCLRERTLVEVYYGDGTARQRAHVATCQRCQGRYQRLVADLATLRQALCTPPLPVIARAQWPARRLAWPWAPVAAAVCGVLLWGTALWWRPTLPDSLPLVPEATTTPALVWQVTSALLTSNELGHTAMGEAGAPLALDVDAIFTEEWSCTGEDIFFNPACGEQGWALWAGEL